MNRGFNVISVPSPKLRAKSRPVEKEEFGEALEQHMNNMLIKMFELNGVGLSGVQIGDNRRILVADSGVTTIKMVNPEVLEESEEKVVYKEGCLSIPGFATEVERSRYIRIKYQTPLGEEVEGTLSDISAVIVQHEIDHLNGKTLLDKVSNIRKNMYIKKLKKNLRKAKKAKKILSQYGY